MPPKSTPIVPSLPGVGIKLDDILPLTIKLPTLAILPMLALFVIDKLEPD